MVNHTLIINKNSEINIKTFKNIDLLYKTCLFRKSDNFICQYKWNNIQINDQLFNVELWGKNIGTKQYTNKCYEISNKLDKTFYNSIAFIFYYSDSNKNFNITIDIWNKFFKNYIKSTSDIHANTDKNNTNKNNTNENNTNKNNNNEYDSNEYDSNGYDTNENVNNDTSNYDNESQVIDNDFECDNDSLINDNDSLNNDFELKELTYEPYYFSSDND